MRVPPSDLTSTGGLNISLSAAYDQWQTNLKADNISITQDSESSCEITHNENAINLLSWGEISHMIYTPGWRIILRFLFIGYSEFSHCYLVRAQTQLGPYKDLFLRDSQCMPPSNAVSWDTRSSIYRKDYNLFFIYI